MSEQTEQPEMPGLRKIMESSNRELLDLYSALVKDDPLDLRQFEDTPAGRRLMDQYFKPTAHSRSHRA